ncbi:MAG: SPOR domain-containing protein, partial [Halarsenatibacteraceae bacterium]
MLTKISGITKKTVLILVLAGFVLMVLSLNVYGENTIVDFAINNQRFVDSIILDSSSFSITPTKDINLKNNEISVTLKKNEQYYIEMIETEVDEKFLTIQIIALSERTKAENIKNELEGYGFTENRIVYEDGLYKLQSGQLESREEAEKYQENLAEAGFEGWVAGEINDMYDFIIRDSSGKIIYQNSTLELSDTELFFNDSWFAGDFKVVQEDGKIRFDIFFPINSAVAGNIAELESSYDREFTIRELELLSIFLRTNLYGYIYKLDNSIINREIGFDKPDSRIIDQ